MADFAEDRQAFQYDIYPYFTFLLGWSSEEGKHQLWVNDILTENMPVL